MKEVAKKDAPAVSGGYQPGPQGQGCTDIPDPMNPGYPQMPGIPGPIDPDPADPK
jgi:hypothetical protein